MTLGKVEDIQSFEEHRDELAPQLLGAAVSHDNPVVKQRLGRIGADCFERLDLSLPSYRDSKGNKLDRAAIARVVQAHKVRWSLVQLNHSLFMEESKSIGKNLVLNADTTAALLKEIGKEVSELPDGWFEITCECNEKTTIILRDNSKWLLETRALHFYLTQHDIPLDNIYLSTYLQPTAGELPN